MDTIVTVLFIFWSSFIIVFAIVFHEMGHAFVAHVFRVTFEFIGLGIAIPIKFSILSIQSGRLQWKRIEWNGILKEFHIGSTKFVIGWLPIGGGVEIGEEIFWSHPWWQRLLIAPAGPIANLVLAFGIFFLAFGFVNATIMTRELVQSATEANIRMITGQIAIHDLTGPVGLVNMMVSSMKINLIMGSILMAAIINVAMAVTNLLPVPALDGGHIVISFLSAVFGSKNVRAIFTPVTRIVFTFLIVLMVILSFKDILL